MFNILMSFFGDMVRSFLIALMEELLYFAYDKVFFIERWVSTGATAILTDGSLHSAYTVLYKAMLVLLCLKLVWKGFQVYILWYQGDPENDPIELVKGSIMAVFVSAIFPELYKIVGNVALTLVNNTLAALFGSNADDVPSSFFENLTQFGGQGTVLTIGILVFCIVAVIVMFKTFAQSAEILVFRLGVPIAALGLVNSDGGLWASYVQMLFKQVFTLLIQYFFLRLGIQFIALGSNLWDVALAITFEAAAFATPRLLAQLTVAQGGGGGIQKASMAVNVVRAFIH